MTGHTYTSRVPIRGCLTREEITFRTREHGGIKYHGRVIEVDTQARFHNRFHKICNTFFRGEPYQLGHETIEYVITLENIAGRMSTQVADFNVYGNILGKIHIGDEVILTAKEKRGRRVAATVYNRTTNSQVRPGLQISAFVFRILILLMILIFGTVGFYVYRFFVSGMWIIILLKLVTALMPALLCVLGIGFLISHVSRK